MPLISTFLPNLTFLHDSIKNALISAPQYPLKFDSRLDVSL